MNSKAIIDDLRSRPNEGTWYEFKENWFVPKELGEYVSALSNAAVVEGAQFAYFVWGINDKTHVPTGTAFDFTQSVKGEPLEHYLARSINPHINIRFDELEYLGKRLILLRIPAAKSIPTSFEGERFIRIGSSKEKLSRYPEKEAELWGALNHQTDSIVNMRSGRQDLSFTSLFGYYASKGLELRKDSFEKNLGLLAPDGSFNKMAELLSDESDVNVRVSVFSGRTKADQLFTVREFGRRCLLNSLDKVLDYGDTFNILQADERNRLVERKEVPLFDYDAYREAVINAFVHNDWRGLNAPMFTFYSDRIEILSRGPLSSNLSLEDFFQGKSEPVNQKLSDIFLQLHISERTGRGVPVIVSKYGRNAFSFSDHWIQVTIPFNFIHAVDEVRNEDAVNKAVNKVVNKNQTAILAELRNNPNITIRQLSVKTGLGHTAVQNNLTKLQKSGLIKRAGSRKAGVWEVIDEGEDAKKKKL